MTRRCTVPSAVSPVGPDLVGSSVAERERVSPQRARFEGAVRVAHRLAIVFRCPIPPTRGRVLSGARLSVTRWAWGGACQPPACVCG